MNYTQPCDWSSVWGSFSVRWSWGCRPGPENLYCPYYSLRQTLTGHRIYSNLLCILMKSMTIPKSEAMQDLLRFLPHMSHQHAPGFTGFWTLYYNHSQSPLCLILCSFWFAGLTGMDLWRVLLTLALAVSSNTFSGSWGESSFPFLTCGVREQRK